MLAALDRGEIAGELEQHALLGHQLACPHRRAAVAGLHILEEIADLDPQRARDLVQPAGRDAIDPGLVLVRLLVGHADQLGHLLLGQAEHDAALANAQAHVTVDVERSAPTANVAAGDFAGELVHCWSDSTAHHDGFPPGENFRSDGTTRGKISPLETVALEKNAIDLHLAESVRRAAGRPVRSGIVDLGPTY